jgi:hypothetical protein
MGDDSIDMVILDIDMGYLVTLPEGCDLGSGTSRYTNRNPAPETPTEFSTG